MTASAAVPCTVVIAAPTLGVGILPTGLVFTWPGDSQGFVLESTDSLTPPIQWSPVAASPIPVGESFQLTIGFDGGTRFFRLRGL
jgi:hypothetical protein